MSKRLLSALLPIVLISIVVACDAQDAEPSIVLISIDTLRADHLSSYGYSRPTPHMDALADDGVLFEQAHTVAPWTLPAHMSMLTGRFPSTHGVVDDGIALAPDTPTLAETLTRQGYRAAGFVAHHYVSAVYGFDRGFDDGYVYRQYQNFPGQAGKTVRGDAVVDAAGEYLQRTRDDTRPYFLFVHLFDAHWTYSAPAPYAGRYAAAAYDGPLDGTLGRLLPVIASKRPMPPQDRQRLIDLYDEEIAYLDDQIGRLVSIIRGLPGGKNTIIVLTSDHGEEFEDHGSLGHSVTLYREQTHVPLIIVDPANERAGVRVSAPVRSVDLAPTIGRFAGLPVDDPFLVSADGQPLQAHLEPGGEPPQLPVVIETTRYGHPRAAAIVGEHKAIAPMDYDFMGIQQTPQGPQRRAAASWRRELELFDLLQDPLERTGLQVDAQDQAVLFLQDWQERTWRGVQIAVRPSPGWRLRLTFPSGSIPFDEAWMDDGFQTLRLTLDDGRLELGGFPPGRTYRIGLPVSIDPEDPVLILEGIAGQAVLLAGGEELALGAGQTLDLDLSREDLRATGSADAMTAGQFRIRTRPRPARIEVKIDPEAEELLRSLGYVGH